jgi:hypothetical protein
MGDRTTTLASILQGESSSRAGQEAVAGVMSNRAAMNYGGYGTSVLDQALGRMQFQGQSTPTAQSLAVAQSVLSGNFSNPVPGSLNYAARAGTTYGPALRALNSGQGVKIGGNTFFHTFEDPKLSLKGAPAASSGSILDEKGGEGFSLSSKPGEMDPAMSKGQIAPAQSSSGQSGSGGGVSGMWEYVGASAVSYAGGESRKGSEQLGKDTIKASEDLAKQIKASEQALTANIDKNTAAGTTALASSTEGTLLTAKNILVRLSIILLGLIVIGGSLYMFKS